MPYMWLNIYTILNSLLWKYIVCIISIMIYTKYRKGKWKLLPKIEEITVGQAHINLIKIFWQHGRLTQSEESKCLWTHDKDGVSLESLWKVPPFLSQPFIISLVTPSLLCIHKHLLSSDWERQPCCQNISIKFPCVFVCLSYYILFNFW